MSPQLVTSDNEVFTVDWDVCTRIGIISSPDVPNEPIPLPNVSSSVLKKVLEYCEHHRTEPLPSLDDEPESDDPRRKRSLEPDEWDRDFIKVDQELLFEIISAANYLDIKPLCDLGCRQVADMIKGKTTAQIRQMFNIAQIRKENEWAEDC